jgi:hypothetical protein
MMETMNDLRHPTSLEFDVDANIELLIGKLVDGSVTQEERVLLAHLIASRTRLMRRDFSSKASPVRRYA